MIDLCPLRSGGERRRCVASLRPMQTHGHMRVVAEVSSLGGPRHPLPTPKLKYRDLVGHPEIVVEVRERVEKCEPARAWAAAEVQEMRHTAPRRVNHRW